MSETLKIQSETEVTIYQVKDDDGNEYSFEADTDSDGDVIITIGEML